MRVGEREGKRWGGEGKREGGEGGREKGGRREKSMYSFSSLLACSLHTKYSNIRLAFCIFW